MKLLETITILALGMFLVGCNGTAMNIANKTTEELKEVNYDEILNAYTYCRKNKRKTQERDKLYAELQRRGELAISKVNSLDDFFFLENSYYTITSSDRAKWYVNNHQMTDKTKQLILEDRFATGWPKDHVLASIGKPYEINRTVTGKIVHEQWLYYSGYYIYFTNGILTSWQD